MVNNYTYPAILDFNEKDIVNIYFPSFENAITCVEFGCDYIKEAQDYLTLIIAESEDTGVSLSNTDSKNYEIKNNQKLVYINIWMPYHRSKIKETYVKKTLTIPSWLDVLAKEANINFSSTLVEALRQKLNL